MATSWLLTAGVAPQLRPGRIAAIDIFRAITVLLMVAVNVWAGVTGLPQWIKHYPADADAMSIADLVFPAFLFIVGMSIPFALQQRKSHCGSVAQSWGHILQRTLGLVVLGLFMVNAESGHHAIAMVVPLGAWALLSYLAVFLIWGSLCGGPAFAEPWRIAGVTLLLALALLYRGNAMGQGMSVQWWGILGLIGWAYLIGCIGYELSRKFAMGMLPGLLLCVAACLLYFVGHKTLGVMTGAGASAGGGWLSLLLSQATHFSHAAIVFCGCITALLFFDERRATSPAHRLRLALGFALLLALLATLLRPEYKISKIHATPAWAMYSSAACVLVFALLHWLLAWRERQKQQTQLESEAVPAWLAPVASNPLVAYLIPFVVSGIMQWAQWEWPAIFLGTWAGLAFGIGYAMVVTILVGQLTARGLRLRI